MTVALLNRFSTSALVLIVVGGTTILAILASLLIRWKFPNLANSDFENLTGILRADVFALLFSIVLGLVIADQSGNLAAASATVSLESSALAELAAASEAFEPSEQVALSTALDEYLHAVVEEEFRSMRTGQDSPRAAGALEALHAAYRQYEPQTEAQHAFYSRSVDNLRSSSTAETGCSRARKGSRRCSELFCSWAPLSSYCWLIRRACEVCRSTC
jgi:hypothetical protein